MGKGSWTASDKATLQALYGKLPNKKLAEQLGKSTMAVRKAAGKLGLHRKSSPPWTPEEEQKLLQLYPAMKAAQVAKLMGRTVAAISVRANHLKEKGYKKNIPRKLPVGAERLNSHGLLVRKMTDTGNQWKDWKRVDVIEWEAINGPVPSGKVLARVNPYLPRSPSNMALFSKEELSAHFTGMSAPPEMRELMLLKQQILRELKKTPVQKVSSAPVPS